MLCSWSVGVDRLMKWFILLEGVGAGWLGCDCDCKSTMRMLVRGGAFCVWPCISAICVL